MCRGSQKSEIISCGVSQKFNELCREVLKIQENLVVGSNNLRKYPEIPPPPPHTF